MDTPKVKYIVNPEDIVRIQQPENKEKTYMTINLPFGLEAYYETEGHYLALYGKDYEIIKIYLNNIQEANCIILGVIEGYRQIKSELFNLGIID